MLFESQMSQQSSGYCNIVCWLTRNVYFQQDQLNFFETCSLDASFQVLVMFNCLWRLLTYQYLISFNVGTQRAVCTLTDSVISTNFRMSSDEKWILARVIQLKRRIQEDCRHLSNIIFHKLMTNSFAKINPYRVEILCFSKLSDYHPSPYISEEKWTICHRYTKIVLN